jgi:DNA-binding Xre family transcriptional regulator
MTDRRSVLRWNLRQVMAARGMFQTSELVPLLAARDIHLSRQYVHRLVTKAPQRVNIDLLAALCDILGCRPGDLLELSTEAVEQVAASGNETGPGIGDLRPIRAKVRRPYDTA